MIEQAIGACGDSEARQELKDSEHLIWTRMEGWSLTYFENFNDECNVFNNFQKSNTIS